MTADIFATITEITEKEQEKIIELLNNEPEIINYELDISDMLYGNTEGNVEDIIKKISKDIPKYHIEVNISGSYDMTGYKIDVENGEVNWLFGYGASEDILECPHCGYKKSQEEIDNADYEWENPAALVNQFAGAFEEIQCPKCKKYLNPYYDSRTFKVGE